MARAFKAWWYLSGLVARRLERRRGRKVYASWDTVKMPLPLYLARSFPVRLERRLRSSLSTASFPHRSWYPHFGQCRLRTATGGESADSSDSAWETFLCTAGDNAAAFTEIVAGLSPCTIFAMPVFVPHALARAIASNAAMVLSETDSLLSAATRTGTNWEGAPVCGTRWISAISASQPSARTVLVTRNRQDSCFQRPGSADAVPVPVSWEVSFRTPSRR